jgi:hypothetical protein
MILDIYIAIINGNIENVKWLLKNGFSYNNRSFIYAIECNNLVVKWLFKNKFPYKKKYLIMQLIMEI